MSSVRLCSSNLPHRAIRIHARMSTAETRSSAYQHSLVKRETHHVVHLALPPVGQPTF